jgi:hypothetical protein
MKKVVLLTFSFLSIYSCQKESDEGLKWLLGSNNEKFQVIENQFRGFDKTMMEVGYRYNELYWAGEDQNWELAEYHIDKIEHTIKLGLRRRPKRRDGAEIIFPILEKLKKITKANNFVKFKEGFKALQQSCRDCHQAEGVPYFEAGIPKIRLSPIGI